MMYMHDACAVSEDIVAFHYYNYIDFFFPLLIMSVSVKAGVRCALQIFMIDKLMTGSALKNPSEEVKQAQK